MDWPRKMKRLGFLWQLISFVNITRQLGNTHRVEDGCNNRTEGERRVEVEGDGGAEAGMDGGKERGRDRRQRGVERGRIHIASDGCLDGCHGC